ncbi:MAG: DUF4874 domain-containing protein [Tunicatimonas sp.]
MLIRKLFRGCTLVLSLALVASCTPELEKLLEDYLKPNEPQPGLAFEEDTEGIFPNPERGWQKTFNPDYFTNEQAPVYTVDQLTRLREEENITLVDKYYILYEFRDAPILQAYLDDFQKDMDALRQAGVKSVVRFAYNFNGDDLADAPLERVLEHIDQLAPYLQQNYDVIAFLEAGFIGKWGEWHGTENDLLGGPWLVAVNDNSRQIYQALLDALPQERMIAMRYLYQMQPLLNQTDCQEDASAVVVFPQGEAFSGTPQARTGRHDDWFFGDEESNSGTWSDDAAARECQKQYLAEISQYVPITTGETQAINDYNRSASPIPQLETFHFASLSENPGNEGGELVDYWKSNGTYDEMARRFGYRFVLMDAAVPETATAGETLLFSFQLVNKGFGSPYNPRLFEVVLRNTNGGGTHHFDVTRSQDNALDPRFWFRENGEMSKTVAFVLEDVPAGEYEVLLHLPDPVQALYGKPEFSIRFANLNTWEEETGYNKLNATVRVE